MTTALPDLILEPLVRAALMEDLGTYGDVTTRSVIPEGTTYSARLRARAEGVVSVCRSHGWPFIWSIQRLRFAR